ncbi:Gnt-I system high-affinity gluconate transporter [Reichenbachiella agariperforans]|uniref:Gnt-I system high-affinity gluconate transporter n=1 Tax=Reichenbachiella agariperforans TaxID=156994 RepID=A0A1M6M7Q9_REIAG|nr:gluconate:H+ symporter [Reichenbachiella agariperforans]SHJ79489.1 Gnt-I system high-affinity gluconate transporter [Reichenbachiella agariperforans]
MPLVVALIGIAVLLLLIIVFRLNAFISFVIVSLVVGLGQGMPLDQVASSIQAGIGNTLGFLIIILGFGAMLGKLVADSGAAQRITTSLVDLFGVKNIQWALVLTGFIVGIPMFYSVGFVILVPLVFAVAQTTRLPLLYVGLPMLASLSVTHGYLPPHPAPSAIAVMFDADLGLTLIYGVVAAIPAIILAGPLFSRTLKRINPTPPKDIFDLTPIPEEELPSLWISIVTALFPLVLIGSSAVLQLLLPEGNTLRLISSYWGNPLLAMLLSVLVAIYTLGIQRGKSMDDVMKSLVQAVSGITMILLIIGGAGALKQTLTDSGVSEYIGEILKGSSLSPLLLAWCIAAAIRVSVGSATVAGLTTAGIILPILSTTTVSGELMVLAIGSGSLMFSHVNDSGFWMFKEYFNLTMKETLSTWTVMETIVSVTGLVSVLILQNFI